MRDWFECYITYCFCDMHIDGKYWNYWLKLPVLSDKVKLLYINIYLIRFLARTNKLKAAVLLSCILLILRGISKLISWRVQKNKWKLLAVIFVTTKCTAFVFLVEQQWRKKNFDCFVFLHTYKVILHLLLYIIFKYFNHCWHCRFI